MSEEKILPSVVPSVVFIEKELKQMGLSERDIITLVQSRTKGRPPKRDIRATLDALRDIENSLIKSKKRREDILREESKL